MKLRAATPDDADAIALVYAPFVRDSAISFETEAPSATEMRRRIAAGGDLYPWLVAVDESGTAAAFAYAGAFRPRPAYRYAVETTIYVARASQGLGAGRLLYGALLATLEAQGFAQAIASITLPNEASVRLHERLGFEPVGAYRKVGYKAARWHDVGLWQRPLAPAPDAPAEPRPWRAAGQGGFLRQA